MSDRPKRKRVVPFEVLPPEEPCMDLIEEIDADLLRRIAQRERGEIARNEMPEVLAKLRELAAKGCLEAMLPFTHEESWKEQIKMEALVGPLAELGIQSKPTQQPIQTSWGKEEKCVLVVSWRGGVV
jgi:hypothetical protein